MNNEIGQRITLKRAVPNPLFQSWLEELHEEAKAKKSKLEPMLHEALDSISKYPLPLKSGAECIVLKGFKRKLCIHLDKRLEVYKHNLDLKTSPGSTCSTSRSASNSPLSDKNDNANNRSGQSANSLIKTSHNSNSEPSHSYTVANSEEAVTSTADCNFEQLLHTKQPTPSSSNASNKQTRSKKYKPTYRSGSYAILIALLEDYIERPGEFLTKEELIDKAQSHSEESFIRPKPDTHYTAWSNMSKLVTKGLVKKVRNKQVKYQLTSEGSQLAKEILEEYKNTPTVNDIIFNAVPSSSRVNEENNNSEFNEATPYSSQSVNSMNAKIIELAAGCFDIVLLIDKNETGGLSKNNDPTVAQFKKFADLNHEYRSLKVGDFTWIARHKVHKDLELVLPYVIERKRMDDFGASVKDGRFHEQKFRLRKCGLKNVIYLVEQYGSNKHVGLPIHYLMQALANTRIQDGFKVQITESLTHSVRFLAMLTKRLTIRYKDKNLKGRNEEAEDEYLMSFEYFNKSSAKSKALTVKETFIKLLLQLKGVSVEKALAITARYNTPRSLIVAYQKCDRAEGESLLAYIKYGLPPGRNVGPAVSRSIYQLFTSYAE